MGTIILTVLLFAVAFGLYRWVFGPLSQPQPGRTAGSTVPAPPVFGILKKAVPSVLVGIALINLLFSVFVVVTAGHVGVVSTFGQIDSVPLSNGLHVVAPWKDVYQMSTQIEKYENKYDAASVDIQAVHAVVSINVALQPACAPETYRKIGVNYLPKIVDPAASEVIKATTALHAASEILSKRPVIKADIQDGITKWLNKYCLDVREVSIKDIQFDKEYMQAVEAKQVAQQLAQKKRNEVEQAKAEADSAIAKAKGEGDALRASAQGTADALRIRGEAESTYNQRVASSLTPALVQKMYLDKWNGELPQYSLGGSTGVLMQLPVPQPKKTAESNQ